MKKNIIKKTLFVLALSGLILTATACKKDTEVANNTSVQEDMEAEITEQAENASTEKEVSNGSTEEMVEVSDNEVTTQTETGTNKAAANTDRPATSNNQSSTAKNTQADSTPIGDASQAFDNTNTTVPNNTTGHSNTTPAQHTHTWVAVTETMNHPEEGHYEQVEIAPAFTQPKYELHTICHGCGFDYTATQTPTDKHVCPDGIRYTYGGQQVQVGTITTPAIYEDQWVVDKAAWTETVTTGYRCSTCGETK